MTKSAVFFLLLLLPLCTPAQELLCNVTIDAGRIQSDRSVFEDMQQSISRYLNFQKWTSDEFQGTERIRCNLQIIVTDRPAPDYFVCTANLQVYRPTYNSSYETLILNVADNSFAFRYVPFQQMVFVDNSYQDNLTALLNYYAYLIIGMDYDTFSPNGGAPYFRKAQEIANQAASASQESGWRPQESNRNRYWVTEGLLNSSYASFHNILYRYHRQGLDQMESNPAQARRAITDSLRDLQRLSRQNPLLVLLKTFLDAKDDELVKVYTTAFINDKQAFVEIMQDVDPSNLARYNSVMTN
ncbi:MAG: DUF4835 family protein [Bacteroidetes bacterium]|jgi:Domain of unknown function (DUF4835)|nr:MAG: DUF4835 family protein [Bacteroidota bacterium]